jgi:hypothetical protein
LRVLTVGTGVGEEGEGTPVKAAAELLITAAVELLLFAAAQDPAMASDF